MCTVTIIRLGPSGAFADQANAGPGCVRLACNRDESRRRPAGLPPVIRRCGPRRAVMPVDPVSDGTWIAVNDAGLAATLLNVYSKPFDAAARGRARQSGKSRGILVPRLMACATLDETAEACRSIDPGEFPPFRIVVLDEREIVHVRSDGARLRHEREALGERPHLFTSSGLGDAVVEPPRRELFERLFLRGADLLVRQDAFHRHSWPDRRDVSVCMERAEARTVSHAVVEIQPDRVRLSYSPDAPDRARALPPVDLTRSSNSRLSPPRTVPP